LSVSLQLSFASVCGLVLVGPACAELLPQRKRWSRRTALSNLVLLIGDGLLTTCCATVFTVPLLLWYFGSFSLAAPVANLLTLWAVAPAMVLGGGALLISGLSVSAGAALMIPARLLLQWLLEVAHTVSLLPGVALSADFLVVWLTAGAIVMLRLCTFSG
jgi:competence protein ComEC